MQIDTLLPIQVRSNQQPPGDKYEMQKLYSN